MKTIKALLDETKAAKGVSTDYALAKALDLHSGLISDYYSGKRSPNEFACLKIAEALGKDYAEISAIVRIVAEKDENRREVWRRYYKSIGGFAASFMMMCLTSVTLIVTTPGNALANQDVINSELHIYKLCDFGRLFKMLGAFVQNTLSICFPRVGLRY